MHASRQSLVTRLYMISLQDTHLSQRTGSLSGPFKEELCNNYFPLHIWHAMLSLCTVQTLLWGENGSFPPRRFSPARHCCNRALYSILSAEIRVCPSEWWDPVSPGLLLWKRRCSGPRAHTAGVLLHPSSTFWRPMSRGSVLDRGACRTASGSITPKEVQPACPRRAQGWNQTWWVGLTLQIRPQSLW